jgi:hypothetical protein
LLRTNGHTLRSLSFSVHVERIEAFRASFTNLLVQSRQDLFFEEIERVDYFVVLYRSFAKASNASFVLLRNSAHVLVGSFVSLRGANNS